MAADQAARRQLERHTVLDKMNFNYLNWRLCPGAELCDGHCLQ